MNKSKRLCLKATVALAAVALSPVSFAQNKPDRFDIVKLVELSCRLSSASEALDRSIEIAVERTGGRYVVAPLALNDDDGRERIYYALRELYPEYASLVRQSIFRAAVDQGLILGSQSQAIAWLTQEGLTNIDWTQVERIAQSKKVTDSINKAIFMAKNAGVSTVPSWVILKNGKYVNTIETFNGDLASARDTVLQQLKEQ